MPIMLQPWNMTRWLRRRLQGDVRRLHESESPTADQYGCLGQRRPSLSPASLASVYLIIQEAQGQHCVGERDGYGSLSAWIPL